MGIFSSTLNRFAFGFLIFVSFSLWTPLQGAPLESAIESIGSGENTFQGDASGISDTIKDVSGQLRSKTSPIATSIEKLTTVPSQLNDFLAYQTNDQLRDQGGLLLSKTITTLVLVFLLDLLSGWSLRFFVPHFLSRKTVFSVVTSMVVRPVVFFGLSMGVFSYFDCFSPVWLYLYHFSLGFLGLRIFLKILVYFLRELRTYHLRLGQILGLIDPLFLGSYLTIFTQSYLNFLGIENPLFGVVIAIFSLTLLALFTKLLVIFQSYFAQTPMEKSHTPLKETLVLLTSKKFWLIFGCIVGGAYFIWAYTTFSHLIFIKFLSSGLILLVAFGVITVLRYLLTLASMPDSLMYKIFPNFAAQFSRSLITLRVVVTLFLSVISIILAAHIWGIHLIEWSNTVFNVNIINVSIDVTIIIFIGLLVTDLIETSFIHYIKYLASKHKAENTKLSHSEKWLNSLLPLFQKAIRILLFIILFLIILSQLGIDITPFLAGLSLLGLAISFGSQTYIKNTIAGLNVLISGCLSVDDLVEIGKFKGRVESLNLRNVELRDLDTGAVHIIPCGNVGEISNYTREYNYCSFELNILPSVNLEDLTQLIQKVLDKMNLDPEFQDMILGPPILWGLKTMDTNTICVQCRFKISPFCSRRIKPAFLERLHRALIQNRIPLSSSVETFLSFLADPPIADKES